MSLQDNAIYDDMLFRWLFEALSPVTPSPSQGKKRKRGAVHTETASGPGRLQSPSPVEGRADICCDDQQVTEFGRGR
ncbi:hypothetical protein E2562_032510 [Oryza meyeriana var. granulata]|uniref:Uncharacterized protein n=1 Tax=Oryza meyeriana var. granulata TaxID=110450 RepID=A0A6G1E5M2_9ORYZ|nr:hypothetical protein E2562_032510 [Oryza meyeriana var. granulata]